MPSDGRKPQVVSGKPTNHSEPVVALEGHVGVRDLPALQTRFGEIALAHRATVSLARVVRLDCAVAWLLLSEQGRMRRNGQELTITAVPPHAKPLIEAVRANLTAEISSSSNPLTVSGAVDGLGRRMVGWGRFVADLIQFLGLFSILLVGAILRPRRLAFTALVRHCEEVGLRAVPIVALMAFLIGIVLAYQGANQLRSFGAEIFVVELIAISVLRELGILLTAIIVAGRTASAFTAAIGSMKMREEIDAMRTLRIDPDKALIFPRLLALVLTLPILGLVADISGLLGGALMAWVELGISPAMFRTRLLDEIPPTHVIVGLVKAPVFALIIGAVGCRAGLRVGNSAESLGRMTSSAVVTAIFAVIVTDALFSILFAQIGL